MGRYQKGNGSAWNKTSTLAILAVVVILLSLSSLKLFAADILVVDVKDAISPPTASYLIENIDEALETNKAAIIIKLDTPGGLDTAMRDIIQKEMNANIPVIVYVSPKGARAASAGAMITLASDVAAMAPGTNIGAAHPVGIGASEDKDSKDSTMTQKVTNDAVAYAKSIARERGRSQQWAEDIVRKSISTQAQEALSKGVIDIVAQDMDDLLNQLEGRKITKNNRTFVISSKKANLVFNPMGFRYRLLSALSNPNVAYILMLIGIAGIYFELSSPGAILPGVIGGISLILAFFAFQNLSVNYAGVALIILAVIMFIAEIKVPSYGLLTVGGIISMLLGSLFLFRTPEINVQVSYGLILPVTVFFSAFFAATIYLVVKAQKTISKIGIETLKEETATVFSWNEDGTGKVFCYGEYWNARGPLTLKPGDRVKVKGIEGMELRIISDEGTNQENK